MIKNIMWDYDECLIHTMLRDPEQNHIQFTLDNDLNTYYTIIRPCAQRLIDFARELVGRENVYILTTSTTDYANTINEMAGFGFDRDHIIAREELARHKFSMAYGGAGNMPKKEVAHKDNILIDNLPWRDNLDKMDLIGITEDRYCKVDNYYGVNFPDDTFEEDVKKFITEKYIDILPHLKGGGFLAIYNDTPIAN